MPGLRLHGIGAELRWSYHLAATLGAWELVYDHGPIGERKPIIVGDYRARILSATFALGQRPLTLVIVRPKTVWRFPVATLVLERTAEGMPIGLRATLGPKEDLHVALRQ